MRLTFWVLLCWVLIQPREGVAQEAATGLHAHPKPVVLAPGYSELEFTAATAGAYKLPPLGEAKNGSVLDVNGEDRQLEEYFGDKIVVMSFIFTTCTDVNGCPLATHVFGKLQDRLRKDPALEKQVRLLSFSFDPVHDTPDVLKQYATYFKKTDFDWQFLTTRTEHQLNPILEDYGQWVIRDYDEQGNALGSMSHVLRVFLIDKARRIRNIYSVSFLHADTVANDIKTVILE